LPSDSPPHRGPHGFPSALKPSCPQPLLTRSSFPVRPSSIPKHSESVDTDFFEERISTRHDSPFSAFLAIRGASRLRRFPTTPAVLDLVSFCGWLATVSYCRFEGPLLCFPLFSWRKLEFVIASLALLPARISFSLPNQRMTLSPPFAPVLYLTVEDGLRTKKPTPTPHGLETPVLPTDPLVPHPPSKAFRVVMGSAVIRCPGAGIGNIFHESSSPFIETYIKRTPPCRGRDCYFIAIGAISPAHLVLPFS